MPLRSRFAIACVVFSLGYPLTMGSVANAATFEVTRTDDPAPGACKAKDCSLREALLAANESGPADTIVLDDRTYELTRSGDSEDEGETGDLDVAGDLRIKGEGTRATTIRAAWAAESDRMVHVLPSSQLMLSKVVLSDGGNGIYEASGIHVDDAGSPKEDPAELVLDQVDLKSMNSGYAVDNYGSARLARVRFTRNSAGEGCCAAFYNAPGSTVTMTNVVFSRNRAEQDTGAFYSDGDKAVLKNVTFANNTAGNVGGAMIASGVHQKLTNVTFFGNKDTGSGGALEVESVTELLINNATFTENVADSDGNGSGEGGGIHVSGGPLSLRNSIVAGNVADSGAEHPDCSGPVESSGYNLFGIGDGCTFTPAPGDVSGTSASPLDARLGPLGFNGGFVPTVALTSGSPAIHKGSPAAPGSDDPTACAARDARNVKRPQGSRCDKGAYERKQ